MLKKRLQDWLTKTGTSRADLATQLHVSVRTVESWLGQKNTRPIPKNKRDIIEDIIRPKHEPGCIAQQLTFTDEEWKLLTEDLPEGVDVHEVLKEMVIALRKATQIPKRHTSSDSGKQ